MHLNWRKYGSLLLAVIILWMLVIISAVAYAQSSIITGTKTHIHSRILGEDREIWVHVPENNGPEGIFAPQRYPVIYVLDGDDHFNAVADITDQLSKGGMNALLPPMIVVGILNTNRTRDLTPTHVASVPLMDSASVAHSGGGENFIAFLQHELIPHIDSLYPAAPYRLFIGHSLGGLMAVHALINHTDLFNAYIAIDPSMMWDSQHLLKQAQAALGGRDFTGRVLYLAMANTMQNGMDTVTVQKATDFMNMHPRSILELGHALDAHPHNGLHYSWKYYPDYSHHTIPLVAAYDGLQSIFSFYKYELPFGTFFQPGYKDDSLLTAHYESISRNMGYKILPPEDLYNMLGYQLMSSKQYDRAYYFFMQNINNYPKSFNTYDSMGDLYMAKGNKQAAKKYYLQSLAVKETADTRKKVEQLNREGIK
jgi:predicted alpha/beta superfamily hydrolase